MLAEQAIREADIYARIEAVQVKYAQLSQFLYSDSSVQISSGKSVVVPLDLVDNDSSSASFVSTGFMRRPELAEQKHLVGEAAERLNHEKFAPLVSSVSAMGAWPEAFHQCKIAGRACQPDFLKVSPRS